jgi:hypothetical protein
LLIIPFFVDIHGQQGSRDLMAEYCTTNWARDPVTCADYIPEDYEEKKAEYQAQEAEKVRQEALQSKLEQESARICPIGSHISTDQFGNQVCVDGHNPPDVNWTFLSYIQFGFVAFGSFCFIMIISGCIKYRDQFQYIRRGLKAKMVFKTIVFLGLFAFGLDQASLSDAFSSVVGLIVTFIGLYVLLSTRFVKPIQRQV